MPRPKPYWWAVSGSKMAVGSPRALLAVALKTASTTTNTDSQQGSEKRSPAVQVQSLVEK